MNDKDDVILRAVGITKYYGGVCALDNVDFELKRGEILGLVGDNGAGKSTLIKIISGVIKKDSGNIFINDNEVEINSPREAKQLGIETVYQDLALINKLNVPDNIFMGNELRSLGVIGKLLGILNYKKMYEESESLLHRLGVELGDLKKPVMNYSGGQRQSIALSKIVYWGKKIAILDEPTAALGVKETKRALDLIKILKDHRLSIIIISHNLQHVFSIVDRIMVLRKGKKVAIKNAHEVSADDIVKLITGVKIIETV